MERAVEPSFGRRELRGVAWTGARIAAEAVIRLASNLILARLLFPEAFGLMALVNVLMVGLAMFSDIGIATSVVQSPRGDEPRFLRTAWTLQAARGVGLSLLAAAFAPLMAHVYGEPKLEALIPVAGLTAVASGFASISLLRMQRRLQIGRLAAIDLSSQVFALVVMVVWIRVQPTVWALVGGGLASSLAKTALSHALADSDAAGFGWDRPSVRELVRFGKWIFVSTIAFFLAGQADRLIFGHWFPLALLGVYGIASTLAALPTQIVWGIGASVLLPTFSRRAGAGHALLGEYRRVQIPVLVAGGLAVGALAAAGPPLVALLYDPRYAEAGWMLQLLAVGIWLQVPQATSANVLLALGQPRWMAVGNGMKLAGMLVLLPLGFAWYGPAGGIAGLALAEGFRYATFATALRAEDFPSFGPDLLVSCALLPAVGLGVLATDEVARRGGGALAQIAVANATVLALWAPFAALLLRRELASLLARMGLQRRASDAGGPLE